MDGLDRYEVQSIADAAASSAADSAVSSEIYDRERADDELRASIEHVEQRIGALAHDLRDLEERLARLSDDTSTTLALMRENMAATLKALTDTHGRTLQRVAALERETPPRRVPQ